MTILIIHHIHHAAFPVSPKIFLSDDIYGDIFFPDFTIRFFDAMDRTQISQLSLDDLGKLIHLCLQEFGRRLGVRTDDSTLFRVNLGSLRPGEPITEAVFPAPPTPPMPSFLCYHRCSRCSQYCHDQNPEHTEHFCPAHASEASTHSTW